MCPRVNSEMQESSAAGYQIRKHYMTYLLKFECESHGRNNEEELKELSEKQKKIKKRKPKAEASVDATTPDRAPSTPNMHDALNAPSTSAHQPNGTCYGVL